MSMEADMIALFNELVNNQVWWNRPPNGMAVDGNFIILQRVGGKAYWYLDSTRPDTAHGRVQVFVWGEDVLQVASIIDQCAARLAASVEQGIFKAVTPYGAPEGDSNPGANLEGLRQHFGVSYLNL